jgi:hypothetical protein
VPLVLAMLTACGGNQSQAAPDPTPQLERVTDPLCVTHGRAGIGHEVTEPTVRAVAPKTAGEAAELTFTYHGHSENIRKLASGQERHQIGLKLRARDGCNLVYVMWRLERGKHADRGPGIDVSVKVNPSASTNEQCGADGYTKLKPSRGAKLGLVPVLTSGDTHTLRAAISGDTLRAWIDGRLVWRGVLPTSVRGLVGPAGVRSDNLDYELVAFAAPRGPETATPKRCQTKDREN